MCICACACVYLRLCVLAPNRNIHSCRNEYFHTPKDKTTKWTKEEGCKEVRCGLEEREMSLDTSGTGTRQQIFFFLNEGWWRWLAKWETNKGSLNNSENQPPPHFYPPTRLRINLSPPIHPSGANCWWVKSLSAHKSSTQALSSSHCWELNINIQTQSPFSCKQTFNLILSTLPFTITLRAEA